MDNTTETGLDDFLKTEEEIIKLFDAGNGGNGEGELLKVVDRYTLQLSPGQIKCLNLLESISDECEKLNAIYKEKWEEEITELVHIGKSLKNFVIRYKLNKRHSGSDIFVLKALEHYSLKNFIGSGIQTMVNKNQ